MEGKPTPVYPGGMFQNPASIFERLLEYGIIVEKEHQLCRMYTWLGYGGDFVSNTIIVLVT